MADLKIEYGADRIQGAKDTGTEFTSTQQSIATTISSDTTGSQLSVMMGAQIQSAEASIKKDTKMGVINTQTNEAKKTASKINQ
jgi:hypothetical protein